MGQGLLSEEEIDKRRRAVFEALDKEHRRTRRQLRIALWIVQVAAGIGALWNCLIVCAAMLVESWKIAGAQAIPMVVCLFLVMWCERRRKTVTQGD